MEKIKSKNNKIIAAMLCIITFLSNILPTISYAWTSNSGEVCSSKEGGYYKSIDGGYYYSDPIENTMRVYMYDENGNATIIAYHGGAKRGKYILVGANGEEKEVYCLESGALFGDSSNSYISSSGTNSNYFRNLPYSAQYGVMLCLLYGWRDDVPSELSGQCNLDDFRFAVQSIIWEYQQQLRTSPTEINDSNIIPKDMYSRSLVGRPAEIAYNWVLNQMKNHSTVPNFSSTNISQAQVQTLKYDTNTKKYTLTVTDTNNTLADINFENSNGISVTRNGNQYTFTSDSMLTSSVTITAKKNIQSPSDKMLVWGRAGYQTMVTGAEDPVRFYIKLETENFGTAHLIKTSEDGNVSGIKFTISGNGVNKSVTTGTDGTINIENLMPGTYTITEASYDKYVPNNSQNVTIVSGQTSTVTFNNTLKRGSLSVTKNSEDGLVENVKFHLYGTSLSGLKVDEYAVTDSTGVAKFNNILISGSDGYTLEEVDTSIKYVVPKTQKVTIKWNEVTNTTITNKLKKFNVTVTKIDVEKEKAQGDASLAGAKYGIYNNGELIDTYETDIQGTFTTKYYVCGDNWTIKEIEASEGYLLNATSYHIGAEAKNYSLEYNSNFNTVTEQVKKGNISIIKHTDNGETQIETPEIGATFQVYLKSAGSYSNAKDSEKDLLTCDENGFAESKQLPYGIYTVHQVNGWEDRELIKDFDVYISETGKTYKYLINNANFESYLKIVKRDIETGKIISLEGTAFQIFDENKNLITMQYTYPEVTTIDIFYTNSDGYLITPQKLEAGNYYIKEVQAPYGYVLDSEYNLFTIKEANSTEENDITVVEISKTNIAQKGIITVEKQGEVYSSVVENEGVYQPIYEIKGLAGAIYEIIADEDIYTQDGTLRASKGEVVDTVTTLEDGKAKSKELYLGKYSVKEIQAPEGMVINSEVHTVELNYAGQEINIVENQTSFYNDRQKSQVSLNKVLEQNTQYGIGNNGEILDVTFGLYANEDIVARDGSIIPENGLIEIITVDENGNAKFNTDLPFGKYYIKEITTNETYKLNENKYEFSFEYCGQDTEIVKIDVNNGENISNDIIYGKVIGKKVTEDGDNLSNAIIGIFKADATEFTTENAIAVTVSSKDGSFEFDKVPYGNWIIREIESPTGFVLSEKEIHINISEENQVVKIELENKYIRGNIELTKVDEDYPDNKLTGAEFEVYEDTNKNGKYDKDDKLIDTLNEVEEGIYRLDDIKYGLVFVIEKTAPYGFIKDENVYSINITENGKTYIVENEVGTGCFINQAKKGSIKITKTSEDGVLSGFSFIVTGVDFLGKEYRQTFITNENGEIFIDNLRIGKYIISEMETEENSRYIIPDSQEVDVQYDKTVEVHFENKLKEIPNTGDNTHLSNWLALFITSTIGLSGICYYKIRKRKLNRK